MADWSWKNAVTECIREIANQSNSALFELDQVYEFVPMLGKMFPRNQHVKDKIRQVLQQLRDEDIILFGKPGHYALNLGSHEVQFEGERTMRTGREYPSRKQIVHSIVIRNAACAREMKARYNYTCQICRIPVYLRTPPHYAEGHHLIPLGSPHDGPDVPGNIVVVCANHHKMLDYGAAAILPQTFRLIHAREGVFSGKDKLYLASWHKLSTKSLGYHYERIFGGADKEAQPGGCA